MLISTNWTFSQLKIILISDQELLLSVVDYIKQSLELQKWGSHWSMYNFNYEYMTFLYVVHVYMFCNVVLYCIALPARVLFAIKIIIIYIVYILGSILSLWNYLTLQIIFTVMLFYQIFFKIQQREGLLGYYLLNEFYTCIILIVYYIYLGNSVDSIGIWISLIWLISVLFL
jgi:hypothetical protein